MADDDTRVTGKTIKLNKLKPNEYRLWVVQAEATFEVYKCPNIVFGKESKPTPSDDSDEESTSVISWDNRHALAREALLKSISSNSSLAKTVRQLSGNVLKTNTANLLTLSTLESIHYFKPYAKTPRPQ